jgi:hypothetical protein
MNDELRTINNEQQTTLVICRPPSAETPIDQQWMIMQNKPNFRKAKNEFNPLSQK